MATDFSMAICGAGPVGLALAAMLVRHGVPAAELVLVDGKPLAASIADPRTIALSYGSRQLLERIGAWPVACDPIREIHISRRGHFGRALLTSTECGVPELGYVCRYGALVERLAAVVADAGVLVQRPMTVRHTHEHDNGVHLTFDNGLALEAGLLLQAEGGLFDQQAVRPVTRDYGQTAIISHVRASALQPMRAYERFTDEGPLALLPQDGGYALVWCMRPEHAQALMAQDAVAFLAALQGAFGERVGRFTGVAARHAFELGLNAHPVQTRRTVAIGNAAQTLHPVAGQGLNLGLRDAFVLAGLLGRQRSVEALGRFVAARSADRRLAIGLTDRMARLFAAAAGGGASQSVLGVGLGLMDAVGPVKKLLAGQMMFGWR
jgi:2-octaprenyl-6-methoxyphenol hydroxylase